MLFYATSTDLYCGLVRVESAVEIKYILTGLFDRPDLQGYATFSKIEGLGHSISGLRDDLSTYLVVPKKLEGVEKCIPQRRGGTKYAVSSRYVPQSVTFTPSAEFGKSCILYGIITGVDTTNSDSVAIYNAFKSEFMDGFQKIRGFMVSPEALDGFYRGVRLTPSAKAERKMDLAK